MPDETTEDFEEWGDQYVYCRQHLSVHKTGWCTVSISDKIALGNNLTPEAAFNKAKSFKLCLLKTSY